MDTFQLLEKLEAAEYKLILQANTAQEGLELNTSLQCLLAGTLCSTRDGQALLETVRVS